MGKKLLPRHLVDHIRQAVALGIEVRRVNLLHIPREHHLGILSGSGYDGLDFVGSKVLRFVYNQQRIRQTTSTNISQSLNDKSVVVLHFFNGTHLGTPGSELIFYEVEIIKKRLHVGGNLLLLIPGEVT